MNAVRKTILFLSLLGMFFAVPSALAHRPEDGDPEGVTLIPSPTTSYAFYREFTEEEMIHIYTFEADAGQFFHAGINIPQLSGLEDYKVSLALLGSGLPWIEEGSLPFHHAYDDVENQQSPTNQLNSLKTGMDLDFLKGLGGIVVESQGSEDFYEPFTQTSYWGRQTLDLDLPESGSYYLLIWNPDGQAGKYVLDTGKEEVFEPGDLMRFPIWWVNTRLYFEQAPQLIAGFFIFAGFFFAGIVVVYRKRRA